VMRNGSQSDASSVALLALGAGKGAPLRSSVATSSFTLSDASCLARTVDGAIAISEVTLPADANSNAASSAREESMIVQAPRPQNPGWSKG
jgi:hypothetical protein